MIVPATKACKLVNHQHKTMQYTRETIEYIFDHRLVTTLGEAVVQAAMNLLTESDTEDLSDYVIDGTVGFLQVQLNVLDALGIDQLPLDDPMLSDYNFRQQLASLQDAIVNLHNISKQHRSTM